MILRGVLPLEVPQRVVRPLWTPSKNQKIRMLGKSILAIVVVLDHVRGGGGPPWVSFDGFQSSLNAETTFYELAPCSFSRSCSTEILDFPKLKESSDSQSLAPKAPTRLAGWF